jgi:uncharacterized membrane protein (UPF0127 family)
MGRLRIDRLATPAGALRDSRGRVVAERVHRADRWPARLVGLVATADLAVDEALWLPACRAVHTIGMRIPIGCAFVDAAGRVLRIVDPLPPGRFAVCRGACAVVECRAGVLAGRSALSGLILGGTARDFPARSDHPRA